MDKFSFFNSAHSAFFEEIYESFLKDPDSVEPSWRSFFQGYQFGFENYNAKTPVISQAISKEFQVINLINDYRKRGHLFTKTNPVRERRVYEPKLDIENFDLNKKDLDIVFEAGREVGLGPSKLSDIIHHLNLVYCQSIGVEYMYIRDQNEITWIKNFIHKNNNHPNFDSSKKKKILKELNDAVMFENFLARKYVGQKRFSLEGAESLIPSLHHGIEEGIKLGVSEFVFGMAHRGRLNILANIFGKPLEEIFKEFEGVEYVDDEFDGDVKYHMGYNSELTESNKKIKLTLVPNPSHLEAVNAVAAGICRTKIKKKFNGDVKKVFPVLIHGDAAISGQGVVYEFSQMSQLKGYQTGGTLHIVINNQVGFTTNYLDARSSTYCTDVAKITHSPVLHVNGDDVEALLHAISFAINYRQTFHKDVFIDLLCYRKYGHNEGDEPRFTQPKLYSIIEKHPNPFEIYNQHLISINQISSDFSKKIQENFKSILEEKLIIAKRNKKTKIESIFKNEWELFPKAKSVDFLNSVDTRIDKETLFKTGEQIFKLPENHNYHRKTNRLFDERLNMLLNNEKVDWGMAELLAYGSLKSEGFDIRISGQDVERGTFSHRHAIVKTINSETQINILDSINETSASFKIYNSFLSEYAVLGFDYGCSLVDPNQLVIWEAQFGDFSNGAQIVLDQYISSAEEKWNLQSGLMLYLPHGYEGQGPEHSSARMERYLQLCAQYNMQIINCTTPSNLFHMLRRQMYRNFKKPLILFSPKSLLRHPSCISSCDELIKNSFKEIIDDNENPSFVKKLVFMSGKIYYDLIKKKKELNNKDVCLIRLEQLYPFPKRKIDSVLKKYNKAKDYIWVQEEPENMGAWSFILQKFRKDYNIKLVSRKPSASPASGSAKAYAKRQDLILKTVFD